MSDNIVQDAGRWTWTELLEAYRELRAENAAYASALVIAGTENAALKLLPEELKRAYHKIEQMDTENAALREALGSIESALTVEYRFSKKQRRINDLVRKMHERAKECPTVYGVFILGEDGIGDVSNIYGSREAAQLEVCWHKDRGNRAHVGDMTLYDVEYARVRWTADPNSGDQK